MAHEKRNQSSPVRCKPQLAISTSQLPGAQATTLPAQLVPLAAPPQPRSSAEQESLLTRAKERDSKRLLAIGWVAHKWKPFCREWMHPICPIHCRLHSSESSPILSPSHKICLPRRCHLRALVLPVEVFFTNALLCTPLRLANLHGS